jgi:hypothetical protein
MPVAQIDAYTTPEVSVPDGGPIPNWLTAITTLLDDSGVMTGAPRILAFALDGWFPVWEFTVAPTHPLDPPLVFAPAMS